MPEPHDELDTWLSVQVKPLLPPPGTFERVTSQARRRRTRRAVLSAAGALAVVAVAAVVIPTAVIPALRTARPTSAAGPAHSLRASAQRPNPASATQVVTPAPQATATITGPLAPPLPPLSVTFVGTSTGWVMSQRLPAQQCDLAAAGACVVLRRTDNAGSAWRTVGSPPAHGPDGATGVSQVRFFNRSNGWAFGPQLWATHNAGATWTKINTGGWRVTDLEARGDRVFSVWARCTGTGAGFASHCTDFAVYSTSPGSDRWTPVPGGSSGPSPTGAASLLLTGTTAYVLLPDGALLSGPLTGAGLQQLVGPGGKALPCPPGPAQPGGQPSGALLAATPSGLALLCAGRTTDGQPDKAVYTSMDGRAWRLTGYAPVAGTASSLSGNPSLPTLVLATSRGMEISANGGATWSTAGGTRPPGGFSYVGMTTATHGVAVPADPAQRTIWFTYDGGRTWEPSAGSA